MFNIILSVTMAFAITFFSIPSIIIIAKHKKLYDMPDARKVHNALIPALGGLAIFAGFALSCLFTITFFNASEFQYFIASIIIIFFLGLKDDIMIISPQKKFAGQILASLLIIFKGGVQIKSMYGFLGLYELPGILSFLFTFLAIIIIINAFNLIDGIDGLAGCLGLMTTLILGIYFLKAGLESYAILALSLAGSLSAFLLFNFQPAKIFMGDSGSLLIGLVSSIIVIKFINVAPHISSFPIKTSLAMGFSILIIPLLDTLRVFCLRIRNRHSPFSADRNHIHHLLLNKGFSHKKITLCLLSMNLLFIVFAYLARTLGNTWLITLSSFFFYAGIGLLNYTRTKQRSVISGPT